MAESSAFNLTELANACYIGTSNPREDKIQAIKMLENNYSEEQLTTLYIYFFNLETDFEIQKHLIKLIDKIKHPNSFDFFINILMMKNDIQHRFESEEKLVQIRVLATKALANLKNMEAFNILLYCLNSKDENYKVRLACAEAMGKLGDKYAVTPLINVVSDDDEKSVYVKESAVKALGMLGDERAVDTLVNILESKRGLIDKFTYLKERAIESLSKITTTPSQKVIKALKTNLMDASSQVRISAISALMDLNHPDSVELIKSTLFDEDSEVIENAVVALYNLTGCDILFEILNDEKYPQCAKDKASEIYKEYESDNDNDLSDNG
ncbi:HEAT repeat domain-containing protein [bacterium]|nr:HEAT repeat domain-containing protein [bacterium]